MPDLELPVLNAAAFYEGDERTWEKVVKEHSPALYILALRLLGHRDDAEDRVQECFLEAFRARRQLRDLNSLSFWLKKICIRLCWRKPRRIKAISLEDIEAFTPISNAALPERTAAAREELEHVLKAFHQLSPRQRVCLELSAFEGHKVEEIAGILSISRGAVKRYLYEARKSLKVIMKGESNLEGEYREYPNES